MRLKVLLPAEVLVDEEVAKVVAEAENGWFCLLPRHLDFVAALVPGLLLFVSPGGQEEFLAVDEGVLVKRGPEVMVSIPNGVRGADLGALRETVETRYRVLDERAIMARSAIGRLEAGFIRRFIELREGHRV